VDQEALVSEFRRSLRNLEKEIGRVWLLLLVAPDEQTTDSWNVIVSADGYDRKTRGAAVRDFVGALRRSVDRAYWPSIARTTVLKKDDPFVNAFKQAYSSIKPGATLHSLNIYGIEIPKAVVVESKQAA
jgi:hypothetical protein